MTERPKIVVLTPVKNEAWILPRFLATTSLWADKIIIADQNSTDESAEICKRFDKVVLIRNENPNYDEAQRQLLLIKAARELVPGPRILFALDADEIRAANAPLTKDWGQMLSARPGTVFKFEKPELYPNPTHCIRGRDAQPLAFFDDNSEHKPKLIHSVRIPMTENSPEMTASEVIILHYAYTRPRAVRAKLRLYSVVENTLDRPVRHRLLSYYRGKEVLSHGSVLQIPPEWIAGWQDRGIDMLTVDDSGIHWQDLEVLSYFSKYGPERFWPDDIWDVDWEAMRQQALASGIKQVPAKPIAAPPHRMNVARFFIRKSATCARNLRDLVKGGKN
jgi:glycosyltransferase involved in cell wall biosynthesis